MIVGCAFLHNVERARPRYRSFLFLSRRITQPNKASDFAQTLTLRIHEQPNDHSRLSLSILSNGRFAVRRSTGVAADWPGMWVISVAGAPSGVEVGG